MSEHYFLAGTIVGSSSSLFSVFVLVYLVCRRNINAYNIRHEKLVHFVEELFITMDIEYANLRLSLDPNILFLRLSGKPLYWRSFSEDLKKEIVISQHYCFVIVL